MTTPLSGDSFMFDDGGMIFELMDADLGSLQISTDSGDVFLYLLRTTDITSALKTVWDGGGFSYDLADPVIRPVRILQYPAALQKHLEAAGLGDHLHDWQLPE